MWAVDLSVLNTPYVILMSAEAAGPWSPCWLRSLNFKNSLTCCNMKLEVVKESRCLETKTEASVFGFNQDWLKPEEF